MSKSIVLKIKRIIKDNLSTIQIIILPSIIIKNNSTIRLRCQQHNVKDTEIIIPPKSRKTFNEIHYKEKKVSIDVYYIFYYY